MGHRLSRILTRTGDTGETGLAGGGRLAKTHPRIAAIGDIDELNSGLGLLLAGPLPDAVREAIAPEQHALFDLGAELSMPGSTVLDEAQVLRLEAAIERLNAQLPPLKEFVLPGGGEAAARCHLARAIARRAERSLWQLLAESADTADPPASARYLNRLSDLLFVCARSCARAYGEETSWRKPSQS